MEIDFYHHGIDSYHRGNGFLLPRKLIFTTVDYYFFFFFFFLHCENSINQLENKKRCIVYTRGLNVLWVMFSVEGPSLHGRL